MSPSTEQPSLPESRFLRGVLAGGAVLAVLWLVAFVAEPYLIQAALPLREQGAAHGARSSASGWGNSGVWLVAQGFCLAVALSAGIVAKRLSPARSWAASFALIALCVVYVFFAQFPATKVLWRIALWALGLPAAVFVGAWFTSRPKSAA